MKMKKELAAKYDHKAVEDGRYDKWVRAGYFTAGDKSKDPFTIVIPPPNVTGILHLGHAWDNTLQDIICRYKRMKGYDVLYLPGMDHAGIATQAKVDARLKSEGISRYDIGREKFLDRAWEWKEEYAATIRKQWAKLGNSLDYSRERFTIGFNKAVRHVFVTLYNEGLIYRGWRIINWDPEARTALSNIEVIYQEDPGKMYYMNYETVEDHEHFIVATTRPETMFGDVCIVVNPNDEKRKHLIGKHCINPANGQQLPIIGDEYIEIGFGTGIMKCTPAHDPNDYQIALRHNLEMPICMNEDGTMDMWEVNAVGQELSRVQQTYTVEGNIMRVYFPNGNGGDPVIFSVDGDSMALESVDDPSDAYVLTRAVDESFTYTAADLAGTWMSNSSGAHIYMTFNEDGTVEAWAVDANGNEMDRMTDTYTIEGNQLTLTYPNGRAPETYDIRIDGDTLMMALPSSPDAVFGYTRQG